jgi:DNA-binding MarR family transcriptional regulator
MGTLVEQMKSAGLTPLQVELLAAYCFGGESQTDIAARRGCSRQATSKIITKAKRKLSRVGLIARRLRADSRGKMYRLDDVDESSILAVA